MRIYFLVTKSFVLILLFGLVHMLYHHLLSVYWGVHLTMAAPEVVAIELEKHFPARLSWMFDCAPSVNPWAAQMTSCTVSYSRLQMPGEMIVETQLIMSELHEDHACVIPVSMLLHQLTWERLGERKCKAPTSVCNNGVLVTRRGHSNSRKRNQQVPSEL